MESINIDFSRKEAILKRIPQASRTQVCTLFTTVISNVTAKNDLESWKIFFSFARDILGNPDKGGEKSKSLASIINKRVALFDTTSQNDTTKPGKNKKPPYLKKQVTENLNQIDVKGAIHITSSNFKILPPTQEVFEKLINKHPSRHPNSTLPDPPGNMSSIEIGRDDVKKAIKSFKNGSAGGPDGILPQHIKDLTCENIGQPALNLLDILVNFINNIILPGKVPEFVQPVFYGANLMALSKPDNGVRPIAIGFTIRRLSGKIIMNKLQGTCKTIFQPHQLGVGKGRLEKGEIGIHAIRQYVNSEFLKKEVILKVDFTNSFNCLRRDEVLRKVKEHSPTIYPYVWQSYSQETNLYFGDFVVKSKEGVQQGDPLGPFLFSLGIIDLISQCKSHFNMWYLDDGALGGTAEDVLSDYKIIVNSNESLGLSVNPSKSEIIIINQDAHTIQEITDRFSAITPRIKRTIYNEDLTLSGSPIPINIEKKTSWLSMQLIPPHFMQQSRN